MAMDVHVWFKARVKSATLNILPLLKAEEGIIIR
jgi:hypothetical protein